MIKNDRVILLLGLIQSLVESSMFIFVYLWTPSLSDSVHQAPLGRIFSCFMIAIMIGSLFFRLIIVKEKF